MSQTVIGLDIGHYSVKALRLSISYRGFSVLGYDEEILDTVLALPEAFDGAEAEPDDDLISDAALEDAMHDAEDAALHAALGELAARGSLDGDAIAVAFPPDLILTGRLSFPFNDPRQLEPIVPIEFEELVPVPMSELLVAHHLVGPSTTQPGFHDVLVTAIKREDLEVFLELWRDGGVDPNQVVMGDASLLNLASTLLPELEEPYAIVDIGHRFTRVACIEPSIQEGKPTPRLGYVRSFQFGGHDLTSALKDALDMGYAEAERFKHHQGQLAINTAIVGVDDVRASDAMKRSLRALTRELRRTFQAHVAERRVAINRIFLCGGTANLRNLAPHLEEEIGVDVELLPIAAQELAGLTLPPGKAQTIAQSLSLGLREALPSNATVAINYRSGSYAHRASRGWLREQAPGIVVALACFFCALGSMFASEYYAIAQEEQALVLALEDATRNLFSEPMAPDKIEGALGGSGDEAGLIPQRSAYDHFIEISNRIPEGSGIEFVDIDIDLYRQLIKIKAMASSAAVVDTYVEQLEGQECFKAKVQKGDTESIGDRVRFDLTIAPECPGAANKDDKKKG